MTSTAHQPEEPLNVVLVGAGAASLTAARALLSSALETDRSDQNPATIGSVTIVEANDYVGGRIRSVPLSSLFFAPFASSQHLQTSSTEISFDSDNGTRYEHHKIDLGAEVIHGSGTILTDVIESETFQNRWKARQQREYSDHTSSLGEVFIACHADGGPENSATKDRGQHGVYYLAEEDKLLRYDSTDCDFQLFSRLTQNIIHMADETVGEKYDAGHSLGEFLYRKVPPRMHGLLQSSYANTVGHHNLNDVDLKVIASFERYWDKHEEDGDCHIHPIAGGMSSVIDTLHEQCNHLSEQTGIKFDVMLNWKVEVISWADLDTSGSRLVLTSGTSHDENSHGSGIPGDQRPGVLDADHVVVTAPPPCLTSKSGITFTPSLPQWKEDAFCMVGMDRAVKIIVAFRRKVWPDDVQTVLVSDPARCHIPEIWFRDIEDGLHLAVGFLTSDAADDFMGAVESATTGADLARLSENKRNAKKGADIMKQQLWQVFGLKLALTIDDINRADASASILHDWSTESSPTTPGGYVYPRVGIERKHFQDMAKSLGNGRLHFAGEATHIGACSTVQAAMETGLRAADEILVGEVSIRKSRWHSIFPPISNSAIYFMRQNPGCHSYCNELIIFDQVALGTKNLFHHEA